MAGILLTLGPVTTLSSVQRLSTIFNTAVRKSRYVVAAKQLESAQLGKFIEGYGSGVFIKKPPAEAAPFLLQPGTQDLCTPDEYADRYNKPPSSGIKSKLQETLVQQGLVPAELFQRGQRGSGVVKTEQVASVEWQAYPGHQGGGS